MNWDDVFLKNDDFIDPKWFRTTAGKTFDVEVGANGKIEIEGKSLSTSFPEGVTIHVDVSRFKACLLSEYQESKIKAAEAQKEKNRLYHEKLDQRRDESLAFHKSVKLPFKWDVARKASLSGLTVNSNGAGYQKNTVYHVLLLEDFKLNRISRKKSDYLCTTQSGGNGKGYSDTNQDTLRFRDSNNKEYTPEVTCAQCLKILTRLNQFK